MAADGSFAAAAVVPPVVVSSSVPLSKLFPDTSKIEAFDGKFYKRWQERIHTSLDMHGVASALTQSEPPVDSNQTQKDSWTHANKVCRNTIINTLSNDLFDVYSVYKKASKIWESLILKYTAKDS